MARILDRLGVPREAYDGITSSGDVTRGIVASRLADAVFHLAAAVGVRLIVESPVRTIETNVYGTQLVLDAASKKKKLVFTASTSEVYGRAKKFHFGKMQISSSAPRP